jgi:hypothetical protein
MLDTLNSTHFVKRYVAKMIYIEWVILVGTNGLAKSIHKCSNHCMGRIGLRGWKYPTYYLIESF